MNFWCQFWSSLAWALCEKSFLWKKCKLAFKKILLLIFNIRGSIKNFYWRFSIEICQWERPRKILKRKFVSFSLKFCGILKIQMKSKEKEKDWELIPQIHIQNKNFIKKIFPLKLNSLFRSKNFRRFKGKKIRTIFSLL